MTTPSESRQQTGSPLAVAREGRVATITIDRPAVHNALNRELLDALAATIVSLSDDKVTRAVVLTGRGSTAFCAGADLNELEGLSAEAAHAVLVAGQRVMRLIETSRLPVIAAVNGLALGGGFELALSCTFIVASENATFALPESGLGLIPGYGGTQRLQRLIGRQLATYLALTGDRLSAGRAYECGLLPVPPTAPDQLVQTAKAIAERIAARSPYATQAILTATSVGGDAPREAGLALEAALAALAVAGPDASEGIAAFRAKRTPNFGAA